LLSRFRGTNGRRLLIDAIRSQKIVAGNKAIARALAATAQLRELQAGETLIGQGGADNDLYLLLSGAVDILIHTRHMASRSAGTHVGEMALIDPGARRSATVVATEHTVAAKISEPTFTSLANQYPSLWRNLAKELGERLRQRTRFVRAPNHKPMVFIGSSTEALSIAKSLRDRLRRPDTVVRFWKESVFGASRFPIEDLERELFRADFAILVINHDDVVVSRGKKSRAPRDNVIFELGLFMGGITRQRTFVVAPPALDLKIPTDLLGLTVIRNTSISDVVRELRTTIMGLGPR
jgi:CRP/FNR family transcriptional regulator, cyclic AMP receptor protein